MKRALEAVDKGYKIGWAVYRAAEDMGIDRLDAFEQVCNRPKTPRCTVATQRGELKTYAPRWLALHFRAVSDAHLDGKPIDEVMRIWINTERQDPKSDLQCLARKVMRENDTTRFIELRDLSVRKGHNMWGSV
jgi:hypothetical protein